MGRGRGIFIRWKSNFPREKAEQDLYEERNPPWKALEAQIQRCHCFGQQLLENLKEISFFR